MGRKGVFCLLYFLAVVFTGLLLAAAVLSWRASFVSPEQGGFWATIALLLPVVLLANLAALVWWLIRRRWIVALMPLAALLLNMGYVSSMIQLPDFNAPAGSHDIRIATLNVNGFRQLGPKSITAAAVAEMMIKVLPEIAKSVAQPLASIDKVSIIGGDASGVSGVSGNVPVLMAQTMEAMKEATGIDMKEIVRANSIQAKTDRNINVTGLENLQTPQASAPTAETTADHATVTE